MCPRPSWSCPGPIRSSTPSATTPAPATSSCSGSAYSDRRPPGCCAAWPPASSPTRTASSSTCRDGRSLGRQAAGRRAQSVRPCSATQRAVRHGPAAQRRPAGAAPAPAAQPPPGAAAARADLQQAHERGWAGPTVRPSPSTIRWRARRAGRDHAGAGRRRPSWSSASCTLVGVPPDRAGKRCWRRTPRTAGRRPQRRRDRARPADAAAACSCVEQLDERSATPKPVRPC